MPGQVHRAAAASTQPRADASWKETTHDGGAAGEKKVQLPAGRCHKMLQKYTHTVNKSYVKALCKTHQDSVSGLAIGVMAVYDSVAEMTWAVSALSVVCMVAVKLLRAASSCFKLLVLKCLQC
jgi:hypothetical protein